MNYSVRLCPVFIYFILSGCFFFAAAAAVTVEQSICSLSFVWLVCAFPMIFNPLFYDLALLFLFWVFMFTQMEKEQNSILFEREKYLMQEPFGVLFGPCSELVLTWIGEWRPKVNGSAQTLEYNKYNRKKNSINSISKTQSNCCATYVRPLMSVFFGLILGCSFYRDRVEKLFEKLH